jgi:hypothetical protein
MTIKKDHDLLVYLAWGLVALALIVGGLVVGFTPDAPDLEARKIRLAAAIGTGLLVLIVFSAVLYYAGKDDKGKVIFDRIVNSTIPIIGAIVGYIFATNASAP